MSVVLEFIVNTFDFNVYILFIISSILLLFLDSKEYKKENLTREYKFAKFVGVFYIILGTILFLVARYIRL
ncbi:MAG: hypothetical protein N2448_02200 [Caloramator sp.]|nr:hypothetical protein [Caloramator sp.]